MNLIYKNIYSRFLYCIVTSKGSVQIHTCHISHCEIISHRIWPIWRAVPIKKFESQNFQTGLEQIFYEEININHTLLWFSQASYMKVKKLDYIGGALK